MVNDSEQSPGEPRQFRKNRFFDGKLMTARDMQTEQRYHADRLETVTRHATGSGILSGLEVTSIRAVDDRLEVAIDSGIALDGLGRPVVVETPTTKSIPEPDGDECHLFVRFDEVETDAVARPDADSRRPDADAGRLVEVFELTYRESPPDRHEPSVGLQDHLDGEAAGSDLGDRIAAGYKQDCPTQASDPAVYLGGFERTADGSWTAIDAPRPHVYDNELLYATLIEHITDRDNPHNTDLDAPARRDPTPEELDSIHERVDYLQSELTTLKARQESTTQHLLGKTLSSAARLFETTAERFVEHHPAVAKAARELGQRAGAASHTDAASDPAAFRATVRRLQPALVAFGDQLDRAARGSTVERYFDALADLQSSLEADDPAAETAIAFDAVAEAAVDLDVLHPAHAER